MYIPMVLGLTVVIPLLATIIEVLAGHGDVVSVAGKWFLFWGVGVRLFTAGFSQVFRPQFTVENILGADNPGATQIVKELGFANLGMGLLGLIAPWIAGWAVPAAIPPLVFLGLAGIVHIAKKDKNTKEWVATLTDLWLSAVLLVSVFTGGN